MDSERNVASSVQGRRHVASPEIVPMPHLDATLADSATSMCSTSMLQSELEVSTNCSIMCRLTTVACVLIV